MIGLIIAEKSEVNCLIKSLKAKIVEFNQVKFYVCTINTLQVIICFSGVGKVNAAIAATNMIINFGVNRIWNVGFCGSSKRNILVGDVLVADKLLYSDVDLTNFGYALNQIPNEPLEYRIKQKYIDFFKKNIELMHLGTIVTADSIVSLENLDMFPIILKKEVIGYEMEATAIAHVCNRTNVDFLCLKIVSDNPTISNDTKEQYNDSIKKHSCKLEKIIITLLNKISIEKI